MSRFKPNVLHGRQYTNRRHHSLKPTNCCGAGSSNSTRFFSPMAGQLRAHSLHPDYLPHSTPISIPHSTSPTPPPINRGGAQGDSAQGLHTAGGPDLTTWFRRLYSQVGAASLSACFVFLWTAGFVGSLCISQRANPPIPHSPPSELRLWDVNPPP